MTENELNEYLSNHPLGDLIDPRNKENQKVQIEYVNKNTLWVSILSAVAGSAVSILLCRLFLPEEKSIGNGIIETD
jgi:hypothetical protein